jgi:hypothetical protein
MLVELSDMYPAVTFIVNALDEVAETGRLSLVDGLVQVMQDSRSLIKIFMSNRDNMDIVARLKDIPNIRIRASDNTADITRFIHQELDRAKLLTGKISSSLMGKIAESLTHGAQGMFRWVDLQIQSLRQLKLPADIEARLGRLPRTLADLYLEIYQQIRESGEHAVRLATFTFQWLRYAQQRLGVNDFARLASVYSRQEIAHTADEILDLCK